MAFNGSGVFVRLYSWVNDAAANIKIRADRMDNEMNGMATGLSTCITKDGQTTITANLPMATFRHTGVGAGASRTDYTRLDQTQDGKLAWVDGGGTADAITATYSIPLTTLVDGQLCYVRATAANATTTPTFSPNSLTARTIVKNGGSALLAGDIAGDGHELILRYDLANTRWELMNPKVTGSVFTDSAFRVTGAADTTKYIRYDISGASTTRVGTFVCWMTADRNWTLPDATTTLVGTDVTQTLTNKTLTAADLNGNTTAEQITFDAGTITRAPAVLTSGTNLTTAAAGSVEYDGHKAMFTPKGTQRGIVPAMQEFVLNADLATANVNTAQNILGVGVSLSASTIYEFEGFYVFTKTAGVTSHTFSLLYGGTATLNAMQTIVQATNGTALTSGLASTFFIAPQGAGATAITGAIAAATQVVIAKVYGYVSVDAAGTLIPQFILSAAPGGAYTVEALSSFKIWPLGASGANISVGTWA